MNKIIKFVFAIGTLAVIMAIFFVGAAYVFEDEIVNGVQLKINQQLDTEISAKEVNFSMLERFPYASIKFNDVWIEDKDSPGDTLLFSKEVFLSFNMMDLVSKNYTIKKAEINEGVMHMVRNEEGSSNYIFWHASENKESTVSFDIEELKLQQMQYTYRLGKDKFELSGYVDELELSGGVDTSGLSLENRIIMNLHYLKYEGATYIENQYTKLEGGISLDKKYKNLGFNDFTLSFGEVELPIEGNIFLQEEIWNVDLQTDHRASLGKLLTVMSDELKDAFGTYDMEGELAYRAKLKGAIDENQVPLLRVNFLLEKGRVKEQSSGVTMDNIYFKGAYQSLQGGSERIEIEDLKTILAGGNINVSGAIENFDNPWLNMEIHSKIDVEKLQRFLKLETIDKMKGSLVINTKFKGPFPNKNISRASLDKLKMSGDMQVADLQLKFSGSQQNFEALNGKVVFNDDDLEIQNLSGTANGSSFDANGELRGFMHYMFDMQDELNLVGSINSPHLDLDALLAEGDSEGEASFSLSNKLNLNLNTKIDRLTYKNFLAEDIHAKVKIIRGLLEVKDVNFNAAQGSVKGDLSIKSVGEDNYKIHSIIDIKDIDIAQIFDQFDQFGQEFIQSQHLLGTGKARIDYQSTMTGGLDIDINSIICNADMEIRDGELLNHPAMKDIYTAMNGYKIIRPFVRLEELRKELTHLKFSQLNNKIRIKNGNIHIPEMRIESNAMDLVISGNHTFDNEIDYKFNFKLSEVLVRRQQTEFGPIADDGTGAKLFMRMYGTTEDPNFEMDAEKARESRQKDFIAEKQNLKQIINEDILGKRKSGSSDKKTIEKTIITIEKGTDSEEEDTENTIVKKEREEDYFEEDSVDDEDDDF